MKNLVKQIEYNGYKINIYPDDYPMNPREWDNVCKMICFHRNYSLGDVKESKKWDSDDFLEFIERENGKSIIALTLYLYDHSGISMSCSSFLGRAQHAEWDSGRVGYAYIEKKEFIKEFGKKDMDKKIAGKSN